MNRSAAAVEDRHVADPGADTPRLSGTRRPLALSIDGSIGQATTFHFIDASAAEALGAAREAARRPRCAHRRRRHRHPRLRCCGARQPPGASAWEQKDGDASRMSVDVGGGRTAGRPTGWTAVDVGGCAMNVSFALARHEIGLQRRREPRRCRSLRRPLRPFAPSDLNGCGCTVTGQAFRTCTLAVRRRFVAAVTAATFVAAVLHWVGG
jgi:hypothetical protein